MIGYAPPPHADKLPVFRLADVEWDDLAMDAADALARRIQHYPRLIETGKMMAADAAADIAAWRMIAADWRWIAIGEGEPENWPSVYQRITALDLAIQRFFYLADRQGGANCITRQQEQQLICLTAMRWWADIEARPQPGVWHARSLAAVFHDYRKNNGYPTLGAMRAVQHLERKAA